MLTVKQMVAPTEVNLKDVDKALEQAIGTLMAVRRAIDEDLGFAAIVPEIERASTYVGIIRSAFSIMALTAMSRGVDFVAATEYPPRRDDTPSSS